MALRVLCDNMMSLGKSLIVIFVDYSAAFDSVSHKFVDIAMKEAGASPKVLAIFRSIYNSAAAFIAIRHSQFKQ